MFIAPTSRVSPVLYCANHEYTSIDIFNACLFSVVLFAYDEVGINIELPVDL